MSTRPQNLEMERGTVLMRRYELERLLGQGTFAKVYKVCNILTDETVAVKIVDKEKVLHFGMIDQIKREIAIMHLIRHPSIVHLREVMGTKSEIFSAMELVQGGELFAQVAKGRLGEDLARKYFQQFVGAVDFCHSRGVYHRDLKPKNLLDDNGNLKVSDSGLSALHGSRRQDGLFHMTCGIPAYVAPEVIHRKGYDGAKADIWSCGVILFVLMVGYLPFNDPNLIIMYGKISRGEFRCPTWFPSDVRKLLSRLLDPNPNMRIVMSKLVENSWFQKGFKPVRPMLELGGSPCPSWDGDVHGRMYGAAAFLTSEDEEKDIEVEEKKLVMSPIRPCCLNAFDIISRSQGFDLSGLLEKEKGVKI